MCDHDESLICRLALLTMFSNAAPSGPPLQFSLEKAFPRSITLSWQYPPEEDRNGVITGFIVQLTEYTTSNVTAVETANTTITISGVKPYTLYYAEVAAFTMEGMGPYTESISVLTPEDGENTCITIVWFITPSVNVHSSKSSEHDSDDGCFGST